MPRRPADAIARVGTALFLVAVGAAAPARGQDKQKVLDFCLKNKAHCALSLAAISEKWERHLNPDRPQSLGSAIKVLHLIAYAQALAGGKVKPDTTLQRDLWARYQTLDGGALAASWNTLGQPVAPRLDDLASTMIRHSDNAFPDWLLANLPASIVAKARQMFPFHDPPLPISGLFGLYHGAQGEGGSGRRMTVDYGDVGVDGFQKEAAALAASLGDPESLADARRAWCVQPPWLPGPPACSPTQPALSETDYRTLVREFFPRSTTRSYLKVYRGLLEGTLLKGAAQAAIKRHLEIWLEIFPTLEPAFTRYGLKGGSLGTTSGQDILTWAFYAETAAKQRYVVVVFLQGLRERSDVPTAADVNAFAQLFGLDAAFRAKVKKALAAADSRPEIVASILGISRQGGKVTLQARIDNASPNGLTKPIQVAFRVSNDASGATWTTLATIPVKTLGGHKSANLSFSGEVTGDPTGRLAQVFADSGLAVAEQEEANNLTWTRIH